MKITVRRARDVRFPTSRTLDESHALNVGDYSATYVTLETDGTLVGHGLTPPRRRPHPARIVRRVWKA